MFAHFGDRRNITHAVNITAEGYIPCLQGANIVEKSQVLRLGFFLAGALGLEPRAYGFGDVDLVC